MHFADCRTKQVNVVSGSLSLHLMIKFWEPLCFLICSFVLAFGESALRSVETNLSLCLSGCFLAILWLVGLESRTQFFCDRWLHD